MNTRLWVGLAIFLTVMNVAVLGTVGWHLLREQPGPERPFGGPGRPPMGLGREDRERLRTILESYRDTIEPDLNRLRDTERELVSAMLDENPDTTHLQTLLTDILQQREKLATSGLEKVLSLRKTLPEEELERLVQILVFRSGGPGGPPR